MSFELFTSPVPQDQSLDAVPHVVAWNLTQRCNLACAHCYIAAGPWHSSGGELTTDEIRRIAEEFKLDHGEFIAARSAYRDYLAVLKRKDPGGEAGG